MNFIYLDNNATTAIDPRVFQTMVQELKEPPSNPSSVHTLGKNAKQRLIHAKLKISSFFKAKPEEIICTSGGTESINLFLRGLDSGHIITTAIDHSSVYKTIQTLEKKGLQATYLPVGPWGAPLKEHIEAAIRPNTQALVFSAANAETGVKLEIEAIGDIAQKYDIPLFIDAIAWIGKEPFPMHPAITAIAVAGHKFHGPKGVGILFVKSSFKLPPLLTGGNQEYQKRAGTENLAAIVGLAKAFDILKEEQTTITQHLSDLRFHFEHNLQKLLPDLQINGEGPRIANTSNLAFPGIDGETLLIQLDRLGIYASHGSACASGSLEPSRVLTHMGIPHKIAASSLRFSIGKFNTKEEIDRAIDIIASTVQKLS